MVSHGLRQSRAHMRAAVVSRALPLGRLAHLFPSNFVCVALDHGEKVTKDIAS